MLRCIPTRLIAPQPASFSARRVSHYNAENYSRAGQFCCAAQTKSFAQVNETHDHLTSPEKRSQVEGYATMSVASELSIITTLMVFGFLAGVILGVL